MNTSSLYWRCMLSTILLSITILFTTSYASAQTRKYERKSVTSLGTVLVKSGLSPDLDIVRNRLKAYIELPRFDFNVISESSIKEFIKKANQTDLSPESIADALKQTVVPKILEVVKATAALRAQGNLKEEDLARAVVDKMKGSGLTAEDIKKVYNSSFIYIPVITDYKEETVLNVFTVEIKGYILWYRIIVSDDGKSASALLLTKLSEPKSGAWSANPDESFQLKRRKVDGRTYARLVAIGGWAQAEALAMRELPEFKLSAEIRSVEGQFATAGLGKREGIELDDGFDVIDFFDDGKGAVVTKDIGFYRASQIADNRTSDDESSLFYGHIHAGVERGSLLVERPRPPLDVRIAPKFATLNIPQVALPADIDTYNNLISNFPFGIFAFNENVGAAAGIDADFALNLARWLGVTQFFAVLGVGFSFPLSTPQNETSTFFWNVHFGFQKKFWFSWINLSLGVLAGLDFLNVSGSNDARGRLEDLNLLMLSGRLDAALELMLNPDLLFSVRAGYKLATSPRAGTIKFRGEDEISLSSEGRLDLFGNINFSGFMLSATISFTFPRSPSFDINAFFPSEIDY
jgi:hypothetical protein